MSENKYDLFEKEEELLESLFPKKSYLLKNKRHEKLILENSRGDKIVRHYIKKPADISVYRTLSTITSSRLCTIYQVSESEDRYAVTEEYCSGMTFAEYIDSEKISDRDKIETACEILKGLHALHSCRVIHRDIKPDNIILCDDNSVKIINFDISKLHKTSNTSDTQLLGTIGYAAPEQFGFTQSDERSDLYSLCVMLNAALTGEHPSVKMYENKAVSKVLSKCLSINPNERYNSAVELYKALKKAQRSVKR